MIFHQYPHKHPPPHPVLSWYQYLYWLNAVPRRCTFPVMAIRYSSAITTNESKKMHIHCKTKRPRKLSIQRLDNLHTFSVIYLCSRSCTNSPPNGNCPVMTGQFVFHIGQKSPKFLKSSNCSAQLAHIALSVCSALYFWLLATSSSNVTGS